MTAGSLVKLVILIHWLDDCGTAGPLVIPNFPYGPENWMGILKSFPCSWCCFVSPVLIWGEFSKLFVRYAPPAATPSDTQGQIVGRAENWGEKEKGWKELFSPRPLPLRCHFPLPPIFRPPLGIRGCSCQSHSGDLGRAKSPENLVLESSFCRRGTIKLRGKALWSINLV